jgi:predicted ATPase
MNLLEREMPLRELHDAFRRVATTGGEMVFLSGEAGIGKTSLIGQFLREIPSGVPSNVVSCDGLGIPGPFGALFDIADALGPDVSNLLEEQAPREDIFRSVLGVFRTTPGTMVMVGEDAHWTDEATLEMFRFLGRRIRSTRVLFIITYRDDQLGPYHPLRRVLGDLANAPGVRRLSLPPLSRDAVRALAVGSGIDPDEIYELTGGNSFLVNEVVESGAEGVPATVMDAVLSRASRLSAEGRAVLDAAATIGVTADTDLLAAVIGGPVADAVEECLAVGILRAQDRLVEFRHGLSRKAILDSMSAPRRRALHRRILDAMQTDRTDERIRVPS